MAVMWSESGADADVLAAEENVWNIGEEIRRILKAEVAAFPSEWIAAWVEADIDVSNKQTSPPLLGSIFSVVIQFQRT